MVKTALRSKFRIRTSCRRDGRSFCRFRKEEDGSSTVEFVIWFPMLVLLIALAVDVGTTFLAINRGWDVARDASRRVAVGELTPAEGEAYAADSIPAQFEPRVTITEEGVRDLRVRVTITPSVATAGALSVFVPEALTINFLMRRETNSNTGGA